MKNLILLGLLLLVGGANAQERLPGIYEGRGMNQTKMNVSLDGIPWNEAGGYYFRDLSAKDGVISMKSIDLKKNKEKETVDFGIGTLGSYRVSGSYTSGLSTKSGWAYYVRGSILGTDGYREHSYEDSKNFSFKVGKYWEKHSLDLFSITGKHNNGQGYHGVEELPKHNTPFKQVPNGCTPQETDNFINTYNRIQYRGSLADNLSLVSTLYWTALKGDYRIGGKDYGWLDNNHLVHNTVGANVVAKWYPTTDISVTGGINGYYHKRTHTGYELPSDTTIRTFHNKNFSTLYKNYGEKPDISVFTTLRWKELEGSIQYRYTSLGYHVIKGGCPGDVSSNYHWNMFNASLGYSKKVFDKDQVYIKWSMVEKEPSCTDMFGGEYFTGELKNSRETELVNDAVIGYEFLRKHINANINLYYVSFSNELVTTGELCPRNGRLPMYSQQDGYRLGIEGSLMWNPIEQLKIIENASWSKNKLKNYKTPPYAPSITSYSEVSWNFGKIEVGVNALYHSKVWLDLENRNSLPDMFSLGINASWRMNRVVVWDVKLSNITNRKNITAGSIGEDGRVYYIIGSPFTAYLNLGITL